MVEVLYNITMARTYKVKATPRQINAVNNILSGEFKSIAEALREAGYSEKSSLNPRHVLANRQGVETYIKSLSVIAQKRWNLSLPNKVALIYLDGLSATKIVGKGIEFPDWSIRLASANTFANFFGWTTSSSPKRRR